MKALVAAAILGLAALPSFASAEMPATIRGVVYSCSTGAPVRDAYVLLHAMDSGIVSRLWTDAHGGFAQVGLAPGRYMIFVPGSIRGSDKVVARAASRIARVDTDDVLDVRLGTEIVPRPPQTRFYAVKDVRTIPMMQQPEPICDAAAVPPAPATSDRYVIH
jgi:hypothetical protein